MRTLKVQMMMALAAVMLLAAVSPAADPGAGNQAPAPPAQAPGRSWRPASERLLDRLKLSEEQRQAIEQIRDQGQKDRLGLRKEIMTLRHDLQGEMLKDEPSQGKVESLAERIGEVRVKLQKSRLQQQLAVRKQLTAEQRDRLLLMGERHRRGEGSRGPSMGSRMGRPQGRGPGARLGRQGGCRMDCPLHDRQDRPRHRRLGGRQCQHRIHGCHGCWE